MDDKAVTMVTDGMLHQYLTLPFHSQSTTYSVDTVLQLVSNYVCAQNRTVEFHLFLFLRRRVRSD